MILTTASVGYGVCCFRPLCSSQLGLINLTHEVLDKRLVHGAGTARLGVRHHRAVLCLLRQGTLGQGGIGAVYTHLGRRNYEANYVGIGTTLAPLALRYGRGCLLRSGGCYAPSACCIDVLGAIMVVDGQPCIVLYTII